MKKICLFALILMLATGAASMQLEQIETIQVKGNNYVYEFEITNNLDYRTLIDVKVLAPVETNALFERQINGGETKTIKVEFKESEKLLGGKYSAQINLRIGTKTVQKKVMLEFMEKEPDMIENGIAGFFSLAPIAIEFSVDAVLLLAAAMLLIAFLARFVKRVKK